MEISEVIREARIKKGLTQQQLADSVYVTRQTISKWELGKSVPDEASLSLLYQCLDITNEKKKQMKKQTVDGQNLFLLIMAVLFSPMIIGIRYCLFKIGKLEDKRFIILIKTVAFVLYVLYLRVLLDNVAYILITITSVVYLAYQYYMLSLEREEKKGEKYERIK